MNETIENKVKATIDEHVKPLIETVNQQQKKIDDQRDMIAKQASTILQMVKTNQDLKLSISENNREVDQLHRQVGILENRIENQEQYSRRTSLRFHNISVPVDGNGRIIHPVDTDNIIVKLCTEKLNVNITTADIGRSHVIGKVKNGKSQVIVRFLSYRVREREYSAKRKLKGNNDKIFITENLTQFRTSIVKGLADLKFNGHIYTYWTSDGRIYVKRFNNSRKMLIRSHNDIRDMLQIAADDEDDLSNSFDEQELLNPHE